MRYLVTGTAGFIGFHLAKRLLDEGHEVVGVDGFTPYYDVQLKERRNALLDARNGFVGHRAMLEDMSALEAIWAQEKIDVVIHLAAQAGVRYSLENPRAYIDANVVGTFNVMELTRRYPVQHFMLASTSSAYGANTVMPFRETDRTATPLTLYAATKAATEQMAHCYAHLWSIPTTAFRFFSVYGTWGRPDMALFKFTKGIIEGTPIDIYNHGRMERDFTYVDDLVEGIYRLAQVPPVRPAIDAEAADDVDSLSPVAPYRIVNIGGGAPVNLLDFIEEIERCVGRKAFRNYMEMQPGDVTRTFANADLLVRLTGYRPSTPVPVGVKAFVDWYREYHSDEAKAQPVVQLF
jgi:UDP-glucuronate 4-epimerase